MLLGQVHSQKFLSPFKPGVTAWPPGTNMLLSPQEDTKGCPALPHGPVLPISDINSKLMQCPREEDLPFSLLVWPSLKASLTKKMLKVAQFWRLKSEIRVWGGLGSPEGAREGLFQASPSFWCCQPPLACRRITLPPCSHSILSECPFMSDPSHWIRTHCTQYDLILTLFANKAPG